MRFLPKTTLSTHLGQLNKWDDSVLKSSDFKQIWQTNRNCYYRLPWFTIFPNFLKENKHTETMDSVCCSGTVGMCLISALSLSLTDKLKALSPCGVPASPTQNSLNMSSDWKHVPLFKQAREQSGIGFKPSISAWVREFYLFIFLAFFKNSDKLYTTVMA